MAGEGSDLLILLLDVPLLLSSMPAAGMQQAPSTSLVEQVLYFVAAYLMMNDSNQLAVYALQSDACDLLYCSADNEALVAAAAANQPTRIIRDNLMAALNSSKTSLDHVMDAAGRGLALSAGLSRALCLIHRLRGAKAPGAGSEALDGNGPQRNSLKPRILCVVSAPDASKQYVATMNAIFSAQRAEVMIDTLMLGDSKSVYLQQAAHLTGGLYVQAQIGDDGVMKGSQGMNGTNRDRMQSQAALQYLLSCMCVDSNTRVMLRVHQTLGVDFRAACFCHKQPVDIGYVCSVCLSIYCTPRQECMCGAQFSNT